MYYEDFRTVWHKKVRMKNWYNSKHLCEYCQFLVCDFLCRNILLHPEQNLLIHLDQNVSIIFGSNIYNENFGTFRQRKVCMKICYSSKSLWILLIFLVHIFVPKMFQYPQLTYFCAFTTKSCGQNERSCGMLVRPSRFG